MLLLLPAGLLVAGALVTLLARRRWPVAISAWLATGAQMAIYAPTRSVQELSGGQLGFGSQLTLRLDAGLAGAPNGVEIDSEDARVVRAKVSDVARDLPALLAAVAAQKRAVEDVEVRGPSLQSVFIHLTGRELRE